MKRALAVFLISVIPLAPNSLAEAKPDIVQVDTGNTENFTGPLYLQSNCYPCWHKHGTYMAHALADEVRAQKLSSVTAVQLVWKNSSDIVSRIHEAVDLRPRVISLSFAGDGTGALEYMALLRASRAGILVLAAAGNEGKNVPQYPAAYGLRCLLAVSTKISEFKDPIANSGDVYLQRAFPEGGTSFSTARMAAIATAFYRRHPDASCQDAANYLRQHFGLHTSP